MSQQLNDDVRDYFAQHQNLLAVADSETRALMWTYYQQLQKKPPGNDEKLEDYIINMAARGDQRLGLRERTYGCPVF
jgi:hypothetical protein